VFLSLLPPYSRCSPLNKFYNGHFVVICGFPHLSYIVTSLKELGGILEVMKLGRRETDKRELDKVMNIYGNSRNMRQRSNTR
jgi:hypothetical protein